MTNLLVSIAEANKQEQYPTLSSEQYLPLTNAGLAEINESAKNPDGSAPVRLTQAGMEQAAQAAPQPAGNIGWSNAPQVAAQAPVQAPVPSSKEPKVSRKKAVQLEALNEVFQVKQISAIPDVKRHRFTAGTAKYPFADLKAPAKDEQGKISYDSFFVPATQERPDPMKTMQSAVTAANHRYSKTTGDTRLNRKNIQVPVRKAERFFVVRKKTENDIEGALIIRTV